VQLRHRRLQRHEHVAFIERVDQVRDDLGVGLALEHIALGLQGCAQLVVVLDDAVVHQGHAASRTAGAGVGGAVAEMGVGVVHRGRAVRGPAGVRNAGAAGDVLGLHLLDQLGHPGRAARAPQAVRMNRHAAGVVTAVLQPLQTLDQNGHHITPRNPCHDAAHIGSLHWLVWGHGRHDKKK
jgi:hypothetical protein